MFPLGNFEYFADDKKHPKCQSVSPDDHQVLLIPLSPSRSPSFFHNLTKSRLAWSILVLMVVFIVLSYQVYSQHMKQLRLLTYVSRVDELKDFMGQVKHHIRMLSESIKKAKLSQEREDVTDHTITGIQIQLQ